MLNILFHSYYIFCLIKESFKVADPCDHFGGFLNNQCNDYFNIVNNDDVCNSYIYHREYVNDVNSKWQPFVKFFLENGKFYDSFSTILAKNNVFNENIDYINEHNKYSNKSYTLGITPFTDMTNEEYIEYISMYKYDVGTNGCVNQVKGSSSYPTEVDWRSKGAVTPVKDQGQCGSCWSFSTTGSVEGIYAIKNGNLQSFSEQQLVDCSYSYGNHGCNGGLMQNAFAYVHDNGLTTEALYPYTATSSRSSCKKFEPVTFVSGCVNVIPNELELTYAVAKQPVSVSIEADSRSFQLYKSGVYDDASCGTTLDHGVLAVGYGTEGGKDYWLVKNSWSASWGDEGYIKIFRNSIESSTKGMCGIAMDASYPTM